MKKTYVLITPAKNEKLNMGRIIETIGGQSLLPIKWVIVNDGSTDGTDHVIGKYLARYPFIELLNRENSVKRGFGSKVAAFKLGETRLFGLNYEYIGNLDADASFAPDYYEKVIDVFIKDKELGIAAGKTVDLIEGVTRKTLSSEDSVGGIAQFFRRKCWEDIGGYTPLRFGGEDSAAEIMARMNGWKVRQLKDLHVFHHREMGTATWGIWKRPIFQGRHFYLLGHHPIFFLFKCIYRCREKPVVLNSFLLLLGYIWPFLLGEKPEMPNSVIRYLRAEQMDKLNRIFGINRFIQKGIPS